MKKICIGFVFFIFTSIHFSFAQPAQGHLRISLLTCAPGDELYSIFGHTALRITDSIQHTDLVYGYGNFDFGDPDFYTKFVRGKLNYFLSVEELPAFLYEYQVTKRDIMEQELRLTDSSKQIIQQALTQNLLGNNRYYKYDFLYDNCTSRVKDLLIKYAGLKVDQPLVTTGTSFRDLIHEYVDRGYMGWTKLGMDLLLGSTTDKAVNISESMFLPDYLMKGINSTIQTNHPLLQKKIVLIANGPDNKSGHNHWPIYILSVVSLLLLMASFFHGRRAKSFTHFFDFLLCALTGMIGVFLLFTWFGTDHTAFSANYNLLWALPTNLAAAIAIWRKPMWLQKYFIFGALVYGLLLVSWYWLPQQLNPALIPIVLLLFLRFARLAKV